jgi:transcriptional regulator with XRE-family HTH domain
MIWNDIMNIDQLTPGPEIAAELGRRLAIVRKAHGYTQTELATAAGIGVATLRRIEGGHDGQLDSWIRILKALGMASAINRMLPENYASPMADARTASRRKKPATAKKRVWGDETK